MINTRTEVRTSGCRASATKRFAPMKKALLYALLFAVIGAVAFAFLSPVLFHDADPRKFGATMLPWIILVCGAGGFIFGWRRNKKQ